MCVGVFQAEWTLVLGEQALDICVPSAAPSASSIFVLGERNLFSLRDNGQIRFMKKLEYNPSCFLPYASGNGLIQSIHACQLSPVNVNPDPFCLPLKIGQKFSSHFSDRQRLNVLENESGYFKMYFCHTVDFGSISWQGACTFATQ